MSDSAATDRAGTDQAEPSDAGELRSVRARSSAAGLDLSEGDLVAVAGFLGGLAPGLAAVAEVSGQLGEGPEEHRGNPAAGVEWR
jgi:hypothetical protein